MQSKKKKIFGKLSLKHFTKKNNRWCYDRKTRPQLAVVDSHLHLRPFGGKPIPFPDLLKLLQKSGILFVAGYGIGQRLPTTSDCTYYLDCPGTKVTPSIKNDMYNAQAVLDNAQRGIVVGISMTFPDLAKPKSIPPSIDFLQEEYPGMFQWMGEVNLVKQALFKNGHVAVPKTALPKWKPFMKMLRQQNTPIAIHSDLGNNHNNWKYLPLFLQVLKLYPKNKIIWMHLGLSKQLTNINAERHCRLLNHLFEVYPNLYADISWRVLYDTMFREKVKEHPYITLINTWPRRFIPGTDFIAAEHETQKTYQKELQATSAIFKDVNDNAFRRIALGQNYFELAKLNYSAPSICH